MATTITPTIVNVNTQVQTAPSVSQLQQSGAIVSAGGTTLAANKYQYCGTLAAVQALLQAPASISSLTWASGTVTATVTGTLGLTSGQTFETTISGAVPAAYNGTYLVTVTGTDTFTYALTGDPGSETSPGTFTEPGVAFVNDAAQTFFAQGNSVGVYVLELGAQATWTAAVGALGTFITTYDTSPQVFYAYLIDANWDAVDAAGLNTLAANYDSPSGQRYFFIGTTSTNVADYANTKSVFAVVPSPTAAATEVQTAAAFYQWLVNQPGPANALAPMAYRYAYGVTPWGQSGNATTINTVLTSYGNLILTGAEGGISTATLFKGTTMDGEQAAFWYGVDYFRIQVKQALAAAIIEGSNSNPPLLYNQAGINTLLAVAQQIASNAVAFGCASAIAVSAVPFATYVQELPNDYANGIYNGFSATFNGQSGFLTITFNLDAVAFA